MRFVSVLLAAMSLATVAQARPGERDQLNACKEMLVRASQPPAPGGPPPDEAQLQRCRQIIKEWTLRDSRMSVDDQGRPMR
jgi:hypothetical protein